MFDLTTHEYDAILAGLNADRNGEALADARRRMPDSIAGILAVMAATALGDVAEAARLVAEDSVTFEKTALGWIAVGNLEQTRGRLSDAFTAYENGLIQAREEQLHETLLYGRIWRDLALARFGDHASFTDLEDQMASARDRGASELEGLAFAFHAAAAAILGLDVSAGLGPLDPYRVPGLTALFLAARIVSGGGADTDLFHRMLAGSEGVRGAPDLVAAAVRSLAGETPSDWIVRHVDPITAFIAADDARLFPSLADAPEMAPMDCARCDGRCCYDGVYVTEPEENRIRTFMKAHPDRFSHVPDAFLEEGEWGFLFHGKRTVRVPHDFARADFPKHFARTKCVFALPTGECALQKAATENDCHPWKIKPELCWEFPLIGLFNDNALAKPHYFGEPDPGFYDADHPGYLSFMPCAKTRPGGTSWKRMYRTEFLHYFKVKGIR